MSICEICIPCSMDAAMNILNELSIAIDANVMKIDVEKIL